VTEVVVGSLRFVMFRFVRADSSLATSRAIRTLHQRPTPGDPVPGNLARRRWPCAICGRSQAGSASCCLLQCMSPLLAQSGFGKAPRDVRFSNRPFRVKRFQTIHHYSVDVAHGLVLLFGIGTRGPSIMGFEDEAERSFGRPCRQTNGRSKRTCELTSSIVPRGTSFHRSVETRVSLWD